MSSSYGVKNVDKNLKRLGLKLLQVETSIGCKKINTFKIRKLNGCKWKERKQWSFINKNRTEQNESTFTQQPNNNDLANDSDLRLAPTMPIPMLTEIKERANEE